MSVKAMSWVWEQNLPTAKKMLLLAIADHADDDGDNAWPSKARLARKVNVTTEYVRRMLRELESEGWISTQQQRGGTLATAPDRRPNLYRINLTREQEADREQQEGRGQPQVVPREQPQLAPRGQPQVALTIPSTSNTSSGTTERRARKPDLIFEAIADECGIDATKITASARGALNRAVKELRQVDADPESIRAAAIAYRQRFPSAPLTPASIAKHYPSLIEGHKPAQRLTEPCDACVGSGYISDDDNQRTVVRCDTCNGTGRVA